MKINNKQKIVVLLTITSIGLLIVLSYGSLNETINREKTLTGEYKELKIYEYQGSLVEASGYYLEKNIYLNKAYTIPIIKEYIIKHEYCHYLQDLKGINFSENQITNEIECYIAGLNPLE